MCTTTAARLRKRAGRHPRSLAHRAHTVSMHASCNQLCVSISLAHFQNTLKALDAFAMQVNGLTCMKCQAVRNCSY